MQFIYGLRCPIEREILYVGKTKDLKNRLRQHLTGELARKSKKTSWIKSLLRKNLKPELIVLEKCSKENVDEREIYWISRYSQNPKNKNMTIGGTGGVTHPPMTKKVMRSDNKLFNSVKDAAKETGVCSAAIVQAVKNGGICAGFKFKYEYMDTFREFKSTRNPLKKVYCSNGKIYNSAEDAGKELGKSPALIRQACYRKYYNCYGFRFWYEGDLLREKVPTGKQIKEINSGIIYSSAREAGRQLNLCYKQISQQLRGKQHQVKGYVFKFI